MADRPYKIMLVEPDSETVEILVASLTRRFDAHISCVVDAETCLDVELVEPHDLVIAEWELGESDGLRLAEQLLSLSDRPVILMAEAPSAEDAVAALRTGVKDLFCKPFAVGELLDAAGRILDGHDLKRRRQVKYHRLRKLVRRVIRERRDLNKRIELVCRDLVDAQRRLVNRVAEVEGLRPRLST